MKNPAKARYQAGFFGEPNRDMLPKNPRESKSDPSILQQSWDELRSVYPLPAELPDPLTPDEVFRLCRTLLLPPWRCLLADILGDAIQLAREAPPVAGTKPDSL